MTWTQQDYQFMSRALQLAKRGRYTCKPNPQVGCVIVRDEAILGEGWHEYAGQAHAEINALKNVTDIAGSTIYVTLEPCAHHGRTPPCIDALIEKNISEIVIAMEDPNPLVSGKGIEKLKASGIQVRTGLLEQQAKIINKGFTKRMRTGLPYISCKMAMSLDGRTALANGRSRWISSEESRKDVHRLRAETGAIASTAESVMADDALLTVREFKEDFIPPLRVIIDRQGKMNESANIFSMPGKVVIYTQSSNLIIKNQQTDIVTIENDDEWLINVYKHLATEYQVNNILVECGAGFSATLINAKLVDELIIFMAPMLLGSDANALVDIKGIIDLNDAHELTLLDSRQIGKDLKLKYQFN